MTKNTPPPTNSIQQHLIRLSKGYKMHLWPLINAGICLLIGLGFGGGITESLETIISFSFIIPSLWIAVAGWKFDRCGIMLHKQYRLKNDISTPKKNRKSWAMALIISPVIYILSLILFYPTWFIMFVIMCDPLTPVICTACAIIAVKNISYDKKI